MKKRERYYITGVCVFLMLANNGCHREIFMPAQKVETLYKNNTCKIILPLRDSCGLVDDFRECCTQCTFTINFQNKGNAAFECITSESFLTNRLQRLILVWDFVYGEIDKQKKEFAAEFVLHATNQHFSHHSIENIYNLANLPGCLNFDYLTDISSFHTHAIIKIEGTFENNYINSCSYSILENFNQDISAENVFVNIPLFQKSLYMNIKE